ncbi:hypothetical protein BCR42DRAFT_337161 [Absidia repens]|uniref:Uncharacterized protein n=1 Tax=Absidia repens TaxID=90262 RepID=A0A1X2I081_9FUNG|nr:hypothetical protein BCR42DRAFT_337161 [Absidia repens]
MKRSLHSIHVLLLLFVSLLLLPHIINTTSVALDSSHHLLPRDDNTTTSSSTTSSGTSNTTNPTGTHSSSNSTHIFHYNQTTVNRTAAFNVDYQLNCKVNDDPFCAKVENGIRLALLEFAHVIDLKTKININITYHSFCDEGCSNSSYGFGIPSSQFILPFDTGPDLNHVYPQALAKQFVRSFDSSSVWAASDVTIELNHDAYMQSVDYGKAESLGWNGTGIPPTGRFWFMDDPTSNINEDQVDFRYVVLHELMHGLGFLSSWAAYFWSSTSPFRQLVENALDDSLLKVVTPGMYWSVLENYGPTFITGFQSTLIFDKFLVSTQPSLANMSQLGFHMQEFCQQDTQAFILNFINSFQGTPQYTNAVSLFDTMATPQTLFFDFATPAVANSTFLTNAYLAATYHNMTLLTGSAVLDTQLEQFDQTSSRPGTAISHVDDDYNSTVDFLMTKGFLMGQTLEQLTDEMYGALPSAITYSIITSNHSIVEHRNYTSPIGPGILRMLDTMGYSTALTNTSYVATGSPSAKFRSSCDDINDNGVSSSNDDADSNSSSSGNNTGSAVSSGSTSFALALHPYFGSVLVPSPLLLLSFFLL